jgi:hypothetical protein
MGSVKLVFVRWKREEHKLDFPVDGILRLELARENTTLYKSPHYGHSCILDDDFARAGCRPGSVLNSKGISTCPSEPRSLVFPHFFSVRVEESVNSRLGKISYKFELDRGTGIKGIYSADHRVITNRLRRNVI